MTYLHKAPHGSFEDAFDHKALLWVDNLQYTPGFACERFFRAFLTYLIVRLFQVAEDLNVFDVKDGQMLNGLSSSLNETERNDCHDNENQIRGKSYAKASSRIFCILKRRRDDCQFLRRICPLATERSVRHD